jgi:hypothetical protein
MPKELPAAHRDIIRIGNEMGYFPSPADAKKISRLVAAEWISRTDGTGQKLSQDQVHELFKWGIGQHMERRV